MFALAGALAFGPGGRDLASQTLSQAYDAGQRNADQVRQDVGTGRDRAEAQTQRAKAQVRSDGDGAVRPA
jgi:hypothetical protein